MIENFSLLTNGAINIMTLAEFYKRLERHDWYWTMSDDIRYYRAGERASGELREIVKENADDPRFQKLYDAFQTFYFENDGSPTPKLEDFE